jgi:hypothetical protein
VWRDEKFRIRKTIFPVFLDPSKQRHDGDGERAANGDEHHNSFGLGVVSYKSFLSLRLFVRFLIMVMVNLPDALQPQPHLDT